MVEWKNLRWREIVSFSLTRCSCNSAQHKNQKRKGQALGTTLCCLCDNHSAERVSLASKTFWVDLLQFTTLDIMKKALLVIDTDSIPLPYCWHLFLYDNCILLYSVQLSASPVEPIYDLFSLSSNVVPVGTPFAITRVSEVITSLSFIFFSVLEMLSPFAVLVIFRHKNFKL